MGFEPTVRFKTDNALAGRPIRPLWHLSWERSSVLAERKGFEPPGLLGLPLSRRVHLSALPPFRPQGYLRGTRIAKYTRSGPQQTNYRRMLARKSLIQSSACCHRASACSRALWACWPAAGYEPRNFTPPCLACKSRSASAISSSSIWPSA